jgi:hypothetical protein
MAERGPNESKLRIEELEEEARLEYLAGKTEPIDLWEITRRQAPVSPDTLKS